MDKVTIKIPRVLYDKIRMIVEDSGFSSPTDFIVYVLRDLVGEQLSLQSGGGAGAKGADELTADEISAIKKRLKNLGYL